MKNVTVLAAIAAAVLILRKQSTSGTGAMTDKEVSLENVRMGMARGWYSAELTHVNGKPAVRLSGKRTDGTYSNDIYPVSQSVYEALKSDGVQEV